MVTQFENLYEAHSSQGTLYITVDNSKFFLNFNESLKVDISLHQDAQSDGLSSSEKTTSWGDYIDLNKVPSQPLRKTSQKVVKAENGQFIPIMPLDQVNLSTAEQDDDQDVLHSKRSWDEIIQIKNKRRKVLSNTQYIQLSNAGSKGKGKSEGQAVTNEDSDLELDYAEAEEDVEDMTTNAKHNETWPVGEGPDLTNEDVSEHRCKHCCKTFDSSQDLKDHRKVKQLSEHNCDECCEVFPFEAFLQVHKKSNHGTSGASLVFKDDQYWYSCDTCNTLVKTLVRLQMHTLSHTGEGYFQCCICSHRCGEKMDLYQHIKCHKSDGKIRCRWCNKWFVDKGTLAKHKLTCKEIRCHLCDNVFPNRTSRNQHYKDFHPNDILKCQLCPYMFSSQEDLDTHMVKHSKFKKKQCTLCGLFFSRLKKHMLIHRTPGEITEDELFYCDKCPAKFKNQTTFNRHRQNHMGDKPYQCPNCPRTFSNCGVLYKHIKRHGTLLPYACEVCGQNCESIDQLKSHMLTHSEDNILFPCTVCTQSFMYRNSLESHMQLKHPETFSDRVIQPTPMVTDASVVDYKPTQDMEYKPSQTIEYKSSQVIEYKPPQAMEYKPSQDIGTVSAYAETSHGVMKAYTETSNGLMEVVIPGITGLAAGQNSEYKIVIVEK